MKMEVSTDTQVSINKQNNILLGIEHMVLWCWLYDVSIITLEADIRNYYYTPRDGRGCIMSKKIGRKCRCFLFFLLSMLTYDQNG